MYNLFIVIPHTVHILSLVASFYMALKGTLLCSPGPVAFPLVQYVVDIGVRLSKFSKSSDYLVTVAKEIIRKRRELKKDPTYVKVCYINASCMFCITARCHI